MELSQGRFVPFSDSTDAELPSGLLCFCKKEVGVNIPHIKRINSIHFDNCYRWAELSRNLMWVDENLLDSKDCMENKEQIVFYPNAEWIIVKNKFQGTFFAAKGGGNDETQHNHNDVGNFIIGQNEDFLLTDLGAGEYSRDYFDENTRYNFIQNRSIGHSVPYINSKEQREGSYRTSNVVFNEYKEKISFEFEMKDVYPEESNLKSYVRNFIVNKNNNSLILKDSMIFNSDNNNVVQNFISMYEPDIEDGQVVWKSDKNKLIMEFSMKKCKVELHKHYTKNHVGNEIKVFSLSIINADINKSHENVFSFTLGI